MILKIETLFESNQREIKMIYMEQEI